MQDLKSNIGETGLFKTFSVLNKYKEDEVLLDKVSMDVPLVDVDVDKIAMRVKNELCKLRKKRFLFLTPEIAIIEQFAEKDGVEEIIVSLPTDYPMETYERICNNMPRNIKVSFITEIEIPENFSITDSAIVAFGCYDGDRALLLNKTTRMLEKYRSFYGCKILAACGKNISGLCPAGWNYVNAHMHFDKCIY